MPETVRQRVRRTRPRAATRGLGAAISGPFSLLPRDPLRCAGRRPTTRRRRAHPKSALLDARQKPAKRQMKVISPFAVAERDDARPNRGGQASLSPSRLPAILPTGPEALRNVRDRVLGLVVAEQGYPDVEAVRARGDGQIVHGGRENTSSSVPRTSPASSGPLPASGASAGSQAGKGELRRQSRDLTSRASRPTRDHTTTRRRWGGHRG